MEEVQSWWEVPAVAHFCYAFRTPFNLVFFEIAELESALLNIQDPDMSLSLEQLITRLLQGCYDEESVNEGNFEEKLHELFNDNLEDDENPFDDSCDFYQLTPRSKIEILLKLCELRLDVEGALDEIKNISPEDMQAKCLGKDSLNNIYWYFCDERLYKEDTSNKKKETQLPNSKDVKNNPKIKKETPPSNSKDVKNNHKNRRSTREKKTNANLNIDKSWTIACFNISDWEKVMQSFSKSKSVNEKQLSVAMKNHLTILQERVAEKDRLLRKRFLELAPKRTSSRISKVQEKKKLEELKAAEKARKAELQAAKERAKKEELLLKKKKESRQRRAEERNRLLEERAAQSQETDDENEDEVFKARGFFQRTGKRTDTIKHDSDTTQSSNSEARSSTKITCSFTTYQFKKISDASEESAASNTTNSKSFRTPSVSQNVKYDVSKDEGSVNSSSASNNGVKSNATKSYSIFKTKGSSSNQTSLNLSNNNSSRAESDINKTLPSRVAVYKTNVLQNAPDVCKWQRAFGSKEQKVHILHNPYDNVASKKIKLERVNMKTVSPNMKALLSKENHIYKPVQTAFITYGKIIPPAIVKLGYRKPSNQGVSS